MHRRTRRRDAWLRHPVGARILRAERARLDEILPDLFGYNLLQVGGWGRHAALCGASRRAGFHSADIGVIPITRLRASNA